MVKIPSSVHVKLNNGLAVRKEILETALRTTELLTKFKEYKKENLEKHQFIEQFKKDISEMSSAVHDIEFKDLPREINKKLTPKFERELIKTPRELKEELKQEMDAPITKSQVEQELDDLRDKIQNIKI